MLKSRSAFRTLAKNRANSPSPSSRQGRLFPPLRQDLGHALVRKQSPMLFAHLKRILRLDRLRLRGPSGAQDEFLLAATAQNLRKLAKLIPIPHPNAGLRATNSRAPDSLQHPKQLGRRLLQHNPPESCPCGLFRVNIKAKPAPSHREAGHRGFSSRRSSGLVSKKERSAPPAD